MFETSYIYSVNIVNTINVINTYHDKNNILSQLNLLLDRSLSVKSTQEIYFDNVWEDVDETLMRNYIDYSKHNFTNLFSFKDITAYEGSSNSDKKSDNESN